MKPGECKMVIVVRTDIPMGKGKIGAQCAHAALECYRKSTSIGSNRRVFNSWLLFGQPKVVLRISSEKELLSLAQKSRDSGLITAVIRDAGRTQLEPGTISVLGIGPAPTNIVDQVTSSLKLL
ncbi:peptidyl-tRNA hydrolase 2, mitochondrial [Belonocnema kinseyi]|uniref:peptidyl-tRNA hydrolase 2, mitochondrial n=1 Tax=Belonocnema kinseyi TaxID=2817044 RepID=UPI00143DCD6B|nr:peptidyl-tRNA hydrolase 2, mitochondrial [Belonocnema kinseyi]